MTKELQKNLKRYSAAAAAIMATGTAADAQIVYTVVNKSITQATVVDSIDINTDGNYDLAMVVYGSGSSAQVGGIPLNGQGHAMAGSTPSGYNYPFKLNSGVAVKTQNFLPADGAGSFLYITGGATPYNSHWQGGVVDGYLAMKIKIGANTHYGWVRMDINATGTLVVIKDMAYNSAPNGEINTGQSLSLAKFADIANSVWATGKTIHSEVIAPYQNGEIVVTDINGKVVTSFDLNHTNEVFDASHLATGTYVLTIKLDEDTISKKVILN